MLHSLYVWSGFEIGHEGLCCLKYFFLIQDQLHMIKLIPFEEIRQAVQLYQMANRE